MVRPLVDIDHQLIKYRYIANKVALNIARKFQCIDYQELEPDCWYGVYKGLVNNKYPHKSTLEAHLFLNAKHEGYVSARRLSRRGFKGISPESQAEVISLEDYTSDLIFREHLDSYIDLDWKYVLSALPEGLDRMFELWYRYNKRPLEIAKTLGYKSAGSVRTILCKHARVLRDKLDRDRL